MTLHLNASLWLYSMIPNPEDQPAGTDSLEEFEYVEKILNHLQKRVTYLKFD